MKFKINLSLSIALIIFSLNTLIGETKSPKYIKLKHEVLHSIDGMPNCIDADAVRNIVIVLQDMKKILYGETPKHVDNSGHVITTAKTGDFDFKGQKYTLMELVDIEKQIKATNNSQDLQDLNNTFNSAKQSFIKMTEPFIGDISTPAIKSFMTKLIEESCHERKRHDSYLMSWSRQNGTEVGSLNRDMKDIETFSIFCTDLCSFLGDLLHSCPKAVAKYKAKYIAQPAAS